MASRAATTVRLASVFCPGCGGHANVMALEAGPQVVTHRAEFTANDGHRVRCRQRFVAVPDEQHQHITTIPVAGRQETERVLTDATVRWLATLSAVLHDPEQGAY